MLFQKGSQTAIASVMRNTWRQWKGITASSFSWRKTCRSPANGSRFAWLPLPGVKTQLCNRHHRTAGGAAAADSRGCRARKAFREAAAAAGAAGQPAPPGGQGSELVVLMRAALLAFLWKSSNRVEASPESHALKACERMPSPHNPKCRPAVIVTPSADIKPDGEVWVVAISS
jgi:hypothetical protein